MIIGVNGRTAPLDVRERFWIAESRRYEALVQLSKAEGIAEIAVLSTPNRTEFLLWTQDAAAASGSVLNFLTREYGLRLDEWKHFYRKLDDDALAHAVRVTSGLDSPPLGEMEIASEVGAAWELARQVETTGRYLDTVLQYALNMAAKVAAGLPAPHNPLPAAAVELAERIFGTLEDRNVLLLGTGKTAREVARHLMEMGARELRIMDRELEDAQAVAAEVGAIAVPFQQRLEQIRQADVVITSTQCPHVVFSREESAMIAASRGDAPLLLIDLAVPRDVDAGVRKIAGMFLYDIDQLAAAMQGNAGQRDASRERAEAMIAEGAKIQFSHLIAERVVPTINAVGERLLELCRQELDSFRQSAGPFTAEQNQAMETYAQRVAQRISNALAHELKELPERIEQDRMTAAIQRLFHLEQLQQAIARTRN